MDIKTPEQRRKNMQQIRSRATKPEQQVAKYLFARGFRYRKNDRRYPGTPDLVLPRYHTVIFVNGCFWHRHAECRYASTPKTNTEFWLNKFDRNVANDRKHYSELEDMGWNVIVIWECEIKNGFEGTMDRVMHELREMFVGSFLNAGELK